MVSLFLYKRGLVFPAKTCTIELEKYSIEDKNLKASIIFNPGAGAKSLAQEIQQAGRFLEEKGRRITWRQTEAPGHATQLARESAAQGDDVAIAVGGDGTVNEVMNGLVHTKTALGIIPAGTANVFAADMRIPLPGPLPHQKLLRAAETLIHSQVKTIDVAEAIWGNGEGRYFLSWAGIGLDAAVSNALVMEKRQHPPLRSLGMMAWMVATFRVLREFRGTRMSIVMDGNPRIERRVTMITISNARRYGRFWRLAPDACLDDTWLDAVVMEGYGWQSSVKHMLNVMLNRHFTDPTTHLYRIKEMQIEAKDSFPVHLDAESVGFAPLNVKIVPHALRILVPPDAPKSLFLG